MWNTQDFWAFQCWASFSRLSCWFYWGLLYQYRFKLILGAE